MLPSNPLFTIHYCLIYCMLFHISSLNKQQHLVSVVMATSFPHYWNIRDPRSPLVSCHGNNTVYTCYSQPKSTHRWNLWDCFNLVSCDFSLIILLHSGKTWCAAFSQTCECSSFESPCLGECIAKGFQFQTHCWSICCSIFTFLQCMNS